MDPEDRVQMLYENAEKSAESVYKPTVPLTRYLRSLESMARVYKAHVDDKNLDSAYSLQIKMVVLFIKFLKEVD